MTVTDEGEPLTGLLAFPVDPFTLHLRCDASGSGAETATVRIRDGERGSFRIDRRMPVPGGTTVRLWAPGMRLCCGLVGEGDSDGSIGAPAVEMPPVPAAAVSRRELIYWGQERGIHLSISRLGGPAALAWVDVEEVFVRDFGYRPYGSAERLDEIAAEYASWEVLRGRGLPWASSSFASSGGAASGSG